MLAGVGLLALALLVAAAIVAVERAWKAGAGAGHRRPGAAGRGQAGVTERAPARRDGRRAGANDAVSGGVR